MSEDMFVCYPFQGASLKAGDQPLWWASPYMCTLTLKEGEPPGQELTWGNELIALAAQHGVTPDDLVTQLCYTDITPAYATIALMHCKNVRIETQERRVRSRGKTRRQLDVRYSVIRLPGTVRDRTSTNIRHDVGAVQPLNLVRGHFKTFTEDAPLFGKYTGTYWWGWQAPRRLAQRRGSAHLRALLH